MAIGMAILHPAERPMPVGILEQPTFAVEGSGEFFMHLLFVLRSFDLHFVLGQLLLLSLYVLELIERLHGGRLDFLSQVVESLELLGVQPARVHHCKQELPEVLRCFRESLQQPLLDGIVGNLAGVLRAPFPQHIGVVDENLPLFRDLVLHQVVEGIHVKIQEQGVRRVREHDQNVAPRPPRQDGAQLRQHVLQLRGHSGLAAGDDQSDGVHRPESLDAIDNALRIVLVNIHASSVPEARRVHDPEAHWAHGQAVHRRFLRLAHGPVAHICLEAHVSDVLQRLAVHNGLPVPHDGGEIRQQV
mmetsp:Transcript_97188/g.279761  ORF Transcript_97188/g.279761 Transcript_97188/m.279761 type:complete len:302 (-) Transcript_97188:387-1292(-)